MRARQFFRIDTTDFILRSAGVALAGGSLAFAAHMLGDPNRRPEIVGMEHLAIYAKPARPAPRPETLARAEIDYTPVGATRGAFSEIDVVGFDLIEAAPGQAVIRTPQGRVTRVAPGARLAGVGAILSIQRRDGKWIVATQAGLIRQR
jgi:hypothetical protein